MEEAEPASDTLQHDDVIGEEIPFAQAQDICHAHCPSGTVPRVYGPAALCPVCSHSTSDAAGYAFGPCPVNSTSFLLL